MKSGEGGKFLMKKFWFPIFILLILMAGTAASFYWGINYPSGHSYRSPEIGGEQVFCMFISSVPLILFTLIWSLSYAGGIREIAELEAFFEKTNKVYAAVVEKTQNVEIKATKELTEKSPQELVNLGQLAYNKLGSVTSERLKEYRGEVESYNFKLKKYQKWNKWALSKGFVPSIPSTLELVDIQ